MSYTKLSVLSQHTVFQVTQVGEAIGNANLIRGMFDESDKFWNAAVNSGTGEHMIQDVAMNGGGKVQAINDYALQIVNQFVTSRHPTLSLLTKRAFSLNAEHRRTVVSHLSSQRFTSNFELFKAIAIDLLCFDPYIVSLAMLDERSFDGHTITKFIAAADGSYLSEEDWNVTLEELANAFSSINFFDRREDLINACLEIIYSAESYIDITDLLLKAIERIKTA